MYGMALSILGAEIGYAFEPDGLLSFRASIKITSLCLRIPKRSRIPLARTSSSLLKYIITLIPSSAPLAALYISSCFLRFLSSLVFFANFISTRVLSCAPREILKSTGPLPSFASVPASEGVPNQTNRKRTAGLPLSELACHRCKRACGILYFQ